MSARSAEILGKSELLESFPELFEISFFTAGEKYEIQKLKTGNQNPDLKTNNEICVLQILEPIG